MLRSLPLLACRVNVQADPPEPEAGKPSEVQPQVEESLTNGGVCFSVWKLLAKAGHGEGHKCLKKVSLLYRALTSRSRRSSLPYIQLDVEPLREC